MLPPPMYRRDGGKCVIAEILVQIQPRQREEWSYSNLMARNQKCNRIHFVDKFEEGTYLIFLHENDAVQTCCNDTRTLYN